MINIQRSISWTAFILIAGVYLISACSLRSPYNIEQSQKSTSTPTLNPSPSMNATPAWTLTITPSPTTTATPAWTLLDDFSERANGNYNYLIEPGGYSKGVRKFYHSACPMEIAGFSLDLLVESTGKTGPFSAYLDLHGLGTVRSWYAQIGYHYDGNKLNHFCQAFSYNSDSARFWKKVGAADYDAWTNFEIEVVPIEEDWQYAFRYLINGEEVCYYQPPASWDGDNRYLVSWRGFDLWVPDQKNSGSDAISIIADNYYGYDSPACR